MSWPEGCSKKQKIIIMHFVIPLADVGIAAHCETQRLLGNDGRKPADVLVPSGVNGSPRIIALIH